MKTLNQILQNNSRQVLAWVVLTCAVLLFAATLSMAQEQGDRNVDGKVHIKMEKEENGRKVKVDTTFELKDLDRMQDYLHGLDEKLNLAQDPSPVPGDTGKRRILRFHSFPFDEGERDTFREDMKRLKSEIKDLENELEELRMEISGDSEISHTHRIRIRQAEEDEFSDFDCGDDSAIRIKEGHCIKIITDNPDGEDRVIIIGDGEEQGNADTRSTEKSTSGGNKKKVIVINRSIQKSESNGLPGMEKHEKAGDSSGKLELSRLECYPNPGKGRFTLSFRSEKKGDTIVKVADPSGKEVYVEKMNGFSGDYSKQIDISQKGKGAYMLKISQNGKSISKKVVVE